jgi:hypothetical protein
MGRKPTNTKNNKCKTWEANASSKKHKQTANEMGTKSLPRNEDYPSSGRCFHILDWITDWITHFEYGVFENKQSQLFLKVSIK